MLGSPAPCSGSAQQWTDPFRNRANQLKIFTELIDVESGEVRWAETYERPVNDVFAVVAEIAEAVVRGVLHTKLTMRNLISDAPNMAAYTSFS